MWGWENWFTAVQPCAQKEEEIGFWRKTIRLPESSLRRTPHIWAHSSSNKLNSFSPQRVQPGVLSYGHIQFQVQNLRLMDNPNHMSICDSHNPAIYKWIAKWSAFYAQDCITRIHLGVPQHLWGRSNNKNRGLYNIYLNIY